jgi:hypothetical protein
MKKLLPLLSVFLISAPVFGQTRVYTNADLDKPQPRTITPEAALATWLTHTGGVPPPIVVIPEWNGPTWVEGPTSDWTATLTPTAPLAPDNGVCYGCYGGYYGGYSPYGVYGPGFGVGMPGFDGGFWPGFMSQGFGAGRRFDGGGFDPNQMPLGARAFRASPFAAQPRRTPPGASVVIAPPAAVRLPTTLPPGVVAPRR